MKKYHTYGRPICHTCGMVLCIGLAELCSDDEGLMKMRISELGWTIMMLVSALAVLIAVLSLLFIV